MREISMACRFKLEAVACLLLTLASCGSKIQFADSPQESPQQPDPQKSVVEENSIFETNVGSESPYAESNAISTGSPGNRGAAAAESAVSRDNFGKGNVVNASASETSTELQKPREDVQPPVEVAQVVVPVGTMSVKELCKALPLKKRSVDVLFGAKTKECLWNKGDNLDPVDGIVRARSEEKIKLKLAANETICGLSFSSPEQTIRFDDELLLTFNDNVVMSSYNYNSRFQNVGGLTKYNWLELIDGYNPGTYNRGVPYCLGVPAENQTDCVVPPSEAPGRLYLKVPEDAAQMLSMNAIKENRAEIGLIVTGDNDQVDCQYSDISFKVDMMVVERL